MRHLIAALTLSLISSLSFAGTISVTDTKNITQTGQSFSFSFASLPNAGTNGLLSIVLNGDYSGTGSEYATLTLDKLSGTARLGDYSQNSNPDSWTNNNGTGITGIALQSFKRTLFGGDDIEQSWTFTLSDATLKNILSDSTFTLTLANSGEVNPYSDYNPDFVKVGLTYTTAEVPEPGSLALFGLGLAGAAAAARRRRRA